MINGIHSINRYFQGVGNLRAVVQRVHSASVTAEGTIVSAIDAGLLVYIGVGLDDSEKDATYLADKVRHLRVFPDESKPLNRDVAQAGGSILAISAFTTQADARKGRRPTLDRAAEAVTAAALYDCFCDQLTALGVDTRKGRFREHMDVSSINDGPICILLDSKRAF